MINIVSGITLSLILLVFWAIVKAGSDFDDEMEGK